MENIHMIKQLFRYRKLNLVIDGVKHPAIIPYYGNNTFIAIDKDGSIFTFDEKPSFNTNTKEYNVSKNGTYDLVARYLGDYANLKVTLYHVKRNVSTYEF